MYEHKCGILDCPMCIQPRMFIAWVIGGQHRNQEGGAVKHITDASCKSCGYVYGRAPTRDHETGAWRKDVQMISDEMAAAAARRAGLPIVAALYDHADAFARGEAKARTAAVGLLAALASPPVAFRPPSGPAPAALPGPPPPDDEDQDDPLAAFLEQHSG